jgi:hypothetical protein
MEVLVLLAGSLQSPLIVGEKSSRQTERITLGLMDLIQTTGWTTPLAERF